MKHVTYMECPEVSLESMDLSQYSFATETYWQDFKKFVGLDDESKAKKRISDLQSTVKDIKAIKSKISGSNKSETVSANITKAVKTLPVEGKTAADIARNLGVYRRKFEKLAAKAEKVETKDQLNELKSEVKELSSQKYPVAEKLQINKSDLLHICDELVLITEIEIDIIKQGLKFKEHNVSTESYVDCVEAVALEGFFSKIGAVLLGIISVWLAIQGGQLMFLTMLFAASGAWAFAVGFGIFAYATIITSQFLFEKATQFWKQED